MNERPARAASAFDRAVGMLCALCNRAPAAQELVRRAPIGQPARLQCVTSINNRVSTKRDKATSLKLAQPLASRLCSVCGPLGRYKIHPDELRALLQHINVRLRLILSGAVGYTQAATLTFTKPTKSTAPTHIRRRRAVNNVQARPPRRGPQPE